MSYDVPQIPSKCFFYSTNRVKFKGFIVYSDKKQHMLIFEEVKPVNVKIISELIRI